MNYIIILIKIIFLIIFYAKTSLANCYKVDNDFDIDNNIKGLKINFIDQDSCQNDYNFAPYRMVIARDGPIKESSSLKFTLNKNISPIIDKTNVISFNSGEEVIAEIFIEDGHFQSIPENILDNSASPHYSISNINGIFQNTSSITFGDASFVGVIDDIKYVLSSSIVPIVAIKSYVVHYGKNGSDSPKNRIKYVPHLNEGLKQKSSIIYYDYKKDVNNKAPLSCKGGFSSTDDLGYYFKKNTYKEIEFTGCCFLDQYPAGYSILGLKTNSVIDFDPTKIGEDSMALNNNNQAVECNYEAKATSDLSYYFDKEECVLKLHGTCKGDGMVEESDLLNSCSKIKKGDIIPRSEENKETFIDCHPGCQYSDPDNKLKYKLTNNIVTISGEKCIPISKKISDWVEEVPSGIYPDQIIEYEVNGSGSINCQETGYEDNSAISYEFEDGIMKLSDSTCDLTPDFCQDGFVLNAKPLSDGSLGQVTNLMCKSEEYSGSITATCTNEGGYGRWIYEGSCDLISCPASEINSDIPDNTQLITDFMISSESECTGEAPDINCSVGTEIIFYCNPGSMGLAKKICQSNGKWQNSGSCN
jgi:hypothetical protein